MSLTTSERVALQRQTGIDFVSPAGFRPVPTEDGGPVAPAQEPTRRPRWGRSRLRDLLLGLVLPVVLLGLWQVLATVGVLDPSRYSSPSELFAALVSAVESGRLWPNLAVSAQRVFLGFAIGAALAIAVGLLVALSRTADRLLSPLLSAIRAVPSLAWVSVLIIWFGIGEENKVGLIAIGAFFPVLATLVAGIRQVDTGLLGSPRRTGCRGVSGSRRFCCPRPLRRCWPVPGSDSTRRGCSSSPPSCSGRPPASAGSCRTRSATVRSSWSS
jgi:hypothetical protein